MLAWRLTRHRLGDYYRTYPETVQDAEDDLKAHSTVAALDTQPGDVTVHFGHTLHAAPPPMERRAAGRRALYVSFVPPLTFEMIGPGCGYNDVLFTRDQGRVRHIDELR